MTKTTILFDEQRSAGEILQIYVKSELFAFTWCPGGEFFTEITDEGRNPSRRPLPQETHISGFWVSSTPVIYAQWLLLMGQESILPPYIEDYPANGMTWLDAKESCVRLTAELRKNRILERNQRVELPTETQWEYACRGGTSTRWSFGDNEQDLKDYGWYMSNSNHSLQPVGQKLPNRWGIYDLYGNVSEWCLDDYELSLHDENMSSFMKGVTAKFRVVRGGDYSSSAIQCQSLSRFRVNIYNTYNNATGVRPVLVSE